MDNFNNEMAPFTPQEIEMILRGENPQKMYRGEVPFTVEEILDEK